MGITVPTQARLMNPKEYEIVTRVMGDTLPYRVRIIITNGAGVDQRPFTIPTSLVTTLLGAAANPFLAPVLAIAGYASSFINAGYLMNVGSAYSDMASGDTSLLVHETTHVWQGKNSNFALSYVFSSCLSQCVLGKKAYDYTAGKDWSSYNVEQQAHIVEDWFGSGEPQSGDLWDYIQNYVRKGKT